jgi:hypothetical protein
MNESLGPAWRLVSCPHSIVGEQSSAEEAKYGGALTFSACCVCLLPSVRTVVMPEWRPCLVPGFYCACVSYQPV